MTNEGAHLRSELKRWYNFWERKLKWGNTWNIKNKEKSYFRRSIRWHHWSFKFYWYRFLLKTRKLLVLGANPHIGSTEAERAASGITRLKIQYRSTIGNKRESDLNLFHLLWISNINIQRVAQMFIRKYPPQKCSKKSVLFEE